MSRKNINLGTNANDGTGDKLRDAMAKVNDNLIELYQRTGGDATLTGIGVTVAGNVIGVNGAMTITTNQNGNLTIAAPTVLSSTLTVPNSSVSINTTEIDPTNSLLVNGNAKIKGNTVLGDTIDDTIIFNGSISSSLIPTDSLTYDIGTTSIKFRDAYIGGTSILDNLISVNANISGGSINSTVIGNSSPNEGRFTILRTLNDSFLGRLLLRDNVISTGTSNSDIEIRPFGSGNLLVSTRMVVGISSTPLEQAIIKAVDNVDGYVQTVIQNLNSGATSSADFFIPRDDGNDNGKYVDFGINSSNYSNPVDFPIHTAGSSYLYSLDSDLFIGTYDSNHDLVLHAGSDASPEGIAIRIKGDTAHIIVGPEDGSTVVTDTGEVLQVNGDLRVNGNLKIQNRTISSSIGTDGDVTGLIAIDGSYIYYCTADYDGSTSIWTRVALSSTPW